MLPGCCSRVLAAPNAPLRFHCVLYPVWLLIRLQAFLSPLPREHMGVVLYLACSILCMVGFAVVLHHALHQYDIGICGCASVCGVTVRYCGHAAAASRVMHS
jgi:hypothetical protein